MKRGLIAWDKEQLPPAVFDARLGRASQVLAERDLPALLVYTDVWRSNQARFLTNFMPYWNRSLVVIPRDSPPVLLCALSPRVYPWIKSVTIFEEIRPASKLMATLDQLCTERGWSKLGVLDLPKLPMEIHLGLRGREIVDVPSLGITDPDDAEFAMRRKAVALAGFWNVSCPQPREIRTITSSAGWSGSSAAQARRIWSFASILVTPFPHQPKVRSSAILIQQRLRSNIADIGSR